MTEITRAVMPGDLVELLASVTHATIAWHRRGQVAAEPAAFQYSDGRYLVGVPPGTLNEGTEVAVLIDDGPMYFDLRGVRIRGLTVALQPSADEDAWFEVRPEREVAWHYGALRPR